MANEVDTAGEAFVHALTNTLWFIDGQHDVFSARSLSIPSRFLPFSGYSRPDLSKHRKRSRENMSSGTLRSCGDSLFGCLQGVYWGRTGLKDFKTDVKKLASSMTKYAEYLESQCESMRHIHLSLKPIRQISENVSFGHKIPRHIHILAFYHFQ